MKAQLDSAYAQLQQGESGLTQAQQQIDSAQAQLSGMKQEIESGPAKLDADGQSVADTKAELDKEKEALDAKAEELSVYEDIAEKVERSRESLIDEGYGTSDSTTAELLSSAGKHESALHHGLSQSSYILHHHLRRATCLRSLPPQRRSYCWPKSRTPSRLSSPPSAPPWAP